MSDNRKSLINFYFLYLYFKKSDFKVFLSKMIILEYVKLMSNNYNLYHLYFFLFIIFELFVCLFLNGIMLCTYSNYCLICIKLLNSLKYTCIQYLICELPHLQ